MPNKTTFYRKIRICVNQLAATVPLAIVFFPQILYLGVELSPLIDSIIATLQIGL